MTPARTATCLGLLLAAATLAACSGPAAQSGEPTFAATAAPSAPASSELPAQEASEAPPAEPSAPAMNTIESGTWLVPSEIAPGVYRVAGYYARLDANGEIIANDGVYGDGELTLLVVRAGDDAVEISGEAVAIEEFPEYAPVTLGASGGTYLVGIDIAPGRYRVSDPDYAYAARLDENLDIIDNEGNEGNVVITIEPGDYAFQYSGTIEAL